MNPVTDFSPSRTLTATTARSLTFSLLLILGFTLLTALGALVRIPLPFTPVPITLQTLMVLLGGAMLGSWRGSMSQVLYLGWGVSGLPLFAGSAAGFAVLAGPTGGYLIGFAVAAWLVGRMIGRATTVWAQAGVFSLGTAVIVALGWLHLTVFFAGGDPMRGLALGVLPFLPGAVVKVVAATSIWRAWTVVRERMG